MSKEERIQKIAKGVQLFREYRTLNGSPISDGMFALDDIEFLLSELEPQTVAETIERPDMRVWLRDTMKDWGAPLSPSEIEIVCCHFENSFVHSPAPEPYREAIDGIRRAMGLSEHYYDTPAKVADAVRTRILYWLEKSQDSSVPDTKGLAEQANDLCEQAREILMGQKQKSWNRLARGIYQLPGVSCSRPCVGYTGIPAFIIWGRRQAGESVASIAADYEISEYLVECALAFLSKEENAGERR